MLENDLSPPVAPTTIYLKDYTPPPFLVSHVNLNFELGEQKTVVTATTHFTRNGQHTDGLTLNGEKFSLLSVTLNDVDLSADEYLQKEDSLTIGSVPDAFTLVVKSELQPHLNTELSGLYQSSGNFCTQCEAEGFRRITYFLDRPDVMAEYRVTMTANKAVCPVLLSNGNLLGSGVNDDGTHWAEWHDPHPKPSYLFALVAGDLERISDSFTTASGAQVALNIYTQAHNIDKCEHALRSLINSMRWDERVYGREYDLTVYNVVAVDDFNMGAMENKGLNIFNSKYVLADQNTATDADFDGIESVIGHEYFHNWSGNRVTCRDWFQLSLKEGLTVFRDQQFSADMGSPAVKRIRDVQVLRAYQFKEDAGPMAHPVRPDSYQEINNFYTVTIYEKGAEVIRMLHAMVGEHGFRKGTDLYFDTFDGQAVTTEDFVRCIEQANSVDLQQFRYWYTQSGTPEVVAKQDYKNGKLTLSFSQSCPPTPGQTNKQPFQIPIKIALFDSKGQRQLSETLVLDKPQQSFDFAVSDKPIVSMLRDFSAPIKLQFEQSDDDLAQLISFDDNGFTRWEAMQRLSLNVLLPSFENQQLDTARYQCLLTAMRSLIESQPSDKAILAEMLTLPSLTYLAELSKPTDPQAIVAMRKRLRANLAGDLQTEFQTLYQEMLTQGEFSHSAEAVAARALKSTTLSYLVETENPQFYALAAEQYHSANNMTDRLSAFASLVHSDAAQRVELIDDFHRQWQHETLVMDKWFAIQAMSSSVTVPEIEALMNHSAFSINNPNKVRALIGAFSGNVSAFHQQDGSGYQFLADQIIKLNEINPQVAARLAGVFNSWKTYAEPYSSNMKVSLERINSVENLTTDVREIISKALT